jgi:hypothetical protein
MIKTLPPAAQVAPHDHLWRRISPESAQYGVLPFEYRCRFCALSWSA